MKLDTSMRKQDPKLAIGSFYQGAIRATFHDLVFAFGEPTTLPLWDSPRFADVRYEWYLSVQENSNPRLGEETATIYLPRAAALDNATSAEQKRERSYDIQTWHIGGFKPWVVFSLQKALLHSLRKRHDIAMLVLEVDVNKITDTPDELVNSEVTS